MTTELQDERLRRWRLSLGKSPDGTGQKLSGDDKDMDEALEALYGDKPGIGKGGKGYPGRGHGNGSGQGTGAGGAGNKGNGQQGGLGESNPS
ncbi:MAG: hypothetical protein AAFV33_25205, partial [Chloroflexota bacterium]